MKLGEYKERILKKNNNKKMNTYLPHFHTAYFILLTNLLVIKNIYLYAVLSVGWRSMVWYDTYIHTRARACGRAGERDKGDRQTATPEHFGRGAGKWTGIPNIQHFETGTYY